jgi:hypothetical protein
VRNLEPPDRLILGLGYSPTKVGKPEEKLGKMSDYVAVEQVITEISKYVMVTDDGGCTFTEEGTFDKDGSPIEDVVPYKLRPLNGRYPTNYIPMGIKLKCRSQVKEIRVRSCYIEPMKPYQNPHEPSMGGWRTFLKIWVPKELVEELTRFMKRKGIVVNNRDSWAEEGGHLRGIACIKADRLKIVDATGGRPKRLHHMKLAEQGLSRRQWAKGTAQFCVSATRRMSRDGDKDKKGDDKPFYVQLTLNSFDMEGWSAKPSSRVPRARASVAALDGMRWQGDSSSSDSDSDSDSDRHRSADSSPRNTTQPAGLHNPVRVWTDSESESDGMPELPDQAEEEGNAGPEVRPVLVSGTSNGRLVPYLLKSCSGWGSWAAEQVFPTSGGAGEF